MVGDNIRLQLLPHTLIGNAAKWYIELPCTLVNTFGALAMEFLKQFHFPIRYKTKTKLLNTLHQDTCTHISHHIHEWRRRMVKAPSPYYLLVDWFCKSLLPQIFMDISLGGAITKYQSIHRAQHLDLIYSQSGTLYNRILNTPRTSNAPATQQPNAHTDGIIDTTFGSAVKQHSAQLSVDLATSSQSAALPTAAINYMQSMEKPSEKNKKNKKTTSLSEE